MLSKRDKRGTTTTAEPERCQSNAQGGTRRQTDMAELGARVMSELKWAHVTMSEEDPGGRVMTNDLQGVAVTYMGYGWDLDPATGARTGDLPVSVMGTRSGTGGPLGVWQEP